jgi:D-threo-aldose 1-dehydrogenase
MIKLRNFSRGHVPVSSIGFGAAGIAGLYREVPAKDANDTLQCAWDNGIRYFDTAPFYGHGLSERRVGDFLRQMPRNNYTLSTKVGRLLRPENAGPPPDHGFVGALPFRPDFDYSYDGVMRSFEDSLQRLGLSRIDVLYVHDIGQMTHGANYPTYRCQLFTGGLRALDELRSSGAIKAVGLGVNEVPVCLEVMAEFDLDCILLANRLTLLDRSAQPKLIGECKRKGVSLVVGGVFNSGILATGAVPGAHYEYGVAPEEIIDRVRRLERVAGQHGIPLAAAALQFPHQFEITASVLIGTAKTESLLRNLALMDVNVSKTAWADFNSALAFDSRK